MTNRAFLIAKDDDTLPNYESDDQEEDEYDEEAEARAVMEIVAASGIWVPVFWLSLFNEEDIRYLELGSDQFPIPITTMAKAKQLLIERQATLRQLCSTYPEELAAWNQLIESLTTTYIRLEGIEIWALSPWQYMDNLPAAIRWFDSRDGSDFAKVLELIGAEPNSTIERLRPTAGNSAKVMLHGYHWVREVPWAD